MTSERERRVKERGATLFYPFSFDLELVVLGGACGIDIIAVF
jgi:hypothetical protein